MDQIDHKYQNSLQLDNSLLCESDPIMNMFMVRLYKIPTEKSEFVDILNIARKAKEKDPVMFFRLLKMHRNIKKGYGMKAFYYICMFLVKLDHPELYSDVLEWSMQYPKDLLILHDISTKFGIETDHEIVMYGNAIIQNLRKLQDPSINANPMYFKYLSYEKHRFDYQTKKIWDYVEKNYE